tara:strand:+ start:163 stop:363 length:201 start_codon:yes stop_codon:yes gene_type:complete
VGGGWLHYYYIKQNMGLHELGDNERFYAAQQRGLQASLYTALYQQPYQTALSNSATHCPIKQPYPV